MADAACELCSGPGGEIVWADGKCRVVKIDDADYPGFCRVVWREHVKEMSDLAPADREHLMQKVFAVETVLRGLTRADKMNLASLGNMTPHVHWHVIPRFHDDKHFPQPVWGQEAKRAHSVTQVSSADIARGLADALGRSSE
jgi:diadenosine tetraphosphate (Ap4A) HIT family hydrolase